MVVQRIARGRHDAVRCEEVTQRRVVPAGVVVVEPQRRLLPLSGEAIGGRRCTEGFVAHLARLRRPAEGVRRAAEMVGQQPVQHTAAAHGDALAAGAVVLLHHPASHFVIVAHVVARHAAHRRLDSPAVAVVDKAGAHRPAHAHQLTVLETTRASDVEIRMQR
jgi:hypothetical protein